MKSVMLCESISDISELNLDNYYANTKFDGIRAYYENGRFYDRHNKDITSKFIELKSDIRGIFDGEIIVVDSNLDRLERFSLIQSRIHLKDEFKIGLLAKKQNIRFMVFDVINDLPLSERKEQLKEVEFENKFWIKVDYVEENIIDFIMIGKERKEEGIILKLKNSLYEEKRSKAWLKLKYKSSADLTFNQYETNPKGITLCSNNHNHRVACNGEQHKEVKRAIDERGICMVEIEYLDLTPTGMYRQIVFKGLK
jgi:ATP-dependent DNA ligase